MTLQVRNINVILLSPSLKALSLLTLFFAFFLCPSLLLSHAPKLIAITQIVSHPALDAIRKGIEEELQVQGFVPGKSFKIIFENAQGNVGTATQIAQKFRGLSPDITIAITTPSAQTIKSTYRGTSLKIVFATVTDPEHAGLVSPRSKSALITGTSDFPPIPEQVSLLKMLLPKLKVLGVLYNPGEANVIKQIQVLEQHLGNIKLVRIPASKSSEIPFALKNKIESIEALYIPLDNTIVSALDSVLKISHHFKKPVFTSHPEGVQQGALATVGVPQYESGRQTGALVAKILKGTPVSQLPYEKLKNFKTYLNQKTVKALGIQIPQILIKKGNLL